MADPYTADEIEKMDRSRREPSPLGKAQQDTTLLERFFTENQTLRAEIERLRHECIHRDLVAPEMQGLRDEIERLRAANDAWMNGVADLVERFGFDRHAASGPADLLPGLELFKVVRDGCVYCSGTNEERPVRVCVRCGTGFYQGEI